MIRVHVVSSAHTSSSSSSPIRAVALERGAAVLVVTHDHRALDVFDVLYEMEDGRIRASEHKGAGKYARTSAP